MSVIKTAAKILFEVLEHEDPELTQFRYNICQGCEKFEKEHERCGVCGCFMDIKTKLTTNRNYQKNRVEITHCPLGKWNDRHIANMYRKMDGIEKLK